MNVPREDVADIMSGDVDEATITVQPPLLGQVVAVRVQGGRARCWVRVLEVWPHQEGGHVVRFERAPAPHTPRLLARTGRAHLEGASKGQSRSKTQRKTSGEVTVRHPDGSEEVRASNAFPKPPRRSEGLPLVAEDHDRGYTTAPFRAVGDEPECVPEDWQKDFSAERSKRDELLRLERVAASRVERWKRKRDRKRNAA